MNRLTLAAATIAMVFFTGQALAEYAAAASGVKPFGNPACWDEPRLFHAGPPRRETLQRISLTRTQAVESDGGADGNGAVSPNGAYTFAVSHPAAARRTPRVARVRIDVERGYRLLLTLRDVTRPVAPEWINEKLLLVRAWWDRDTGADLLVDVEAEKIIYTERLRDGAQTYRRAQDKQCDG